MTLPDHLCKFVHEGKNNIKRGSIHSFRETKFLIRVKKSNACSVNYLFSRPQIALGPFCGHRPDKLHTPSALSSVEGIVGRNRDRKAFVVPQRRRKELAVGRATLDLLFVVEVRVIRLQRFRLG
jgi:hypothetical protein